MEGSSVGPIKTGVVGYHNLYTPSLVNTCSTLSPAYIPPTTMDPTTVPPPSPPPPNPHTPAVDLTQPPAFDCSQKAEPSTNRNMDNFKQLVMKLAGRLLPAHQSLVDRRFDRILPGEVLVPDHPPYADMILTALWELKAEGGSSEEDISHFIQREYNNLPWAHATILNHHLRDLCKKGKITMTHDRCYIRAPSITNPESSSSPSPLSSDYDYSSSPTSSSTSPSSSSSSLSWGGPYRRKKRRKNKRRRGMMVRVRGRDTGRGRGRGRGGTGRRPLPLRRGRARFGVEGRNTVEEPEQGNEDQNEVTSMGVEDYSIKDKDLPDVSAKISEEESMSCEQNNKEQSRPQKRYNVTWIGRRSRKLKEEAEIDILNVQCDDDVSDAKVDEHVEPLKQKEENEATAMEHNCQEENQLYDIAEEQTLGEERVMDDGNLPIEQDLVMMRCEAQVTVTGAGVKKQHGGTSEEQIQHEENKEGFQTHEQELRVGEQKLVETTETNKQLDRLTKEQVETKEQSAEMDILNVQSDDDVSDAKVDERVEQLKQKEENEATDMECNCQEKNQLYDIAEEQTLGEERVMDDGNLPIEQYSVMMRCEAQVTVTDVHVEKQHGGTSEEQIQHEENKEGFQTHEQELRVGEQKLVETTETNKQLDRLTNEQVETKEQSAEMDILNVQSDDDVSDAKVDERFEQLKQKEENEATDMVRNCQEENQLYDIAEEQTLGEERVMDDGILPIEQYSVMMRCEAQVTVTDAHVEKQHGGTSEEQIQHEENKEGFQTHEQELRDGEQKLVETTETNMQLDRLTKEQVETKEQSADQHDDDDDNDVNEEPIHQQEQCVEKTEESPQSCEHDQFKNVEAESAEQEEQRTEVNQKETLLAEVELEQFVEITEQQNQPSIQQTELSEKDLLQENNNSVRNEENTTSSGSMSEGSRRSSRPGLRSSSKKEDAAPKSKKQLELGTPIRRSLRSHNTVSEAVVINEELDNAKEQVTYSGRTRSSKRKTDIVEAEQVSSTRKTRRTGL